MIFTEEMSNFCLNITTKVKGTGVRVLEGIAYL